MRLRKIAVFLLALASAFLASVVAATAWAPPRGSPVRAGIMDGLRPHVERDLGPPLLFTVKAINVEGPWAFVSVAPVRPDGRAVDWSRTRFGRDIARGAMSTSILALLRGSGSRWQVVEYAFGPTDVPWEDWVGKHGIARGFFEAAYAGGAAEDGGRVAQPTPQPAPPAAQQQASGQGQAAPWQPGPDWKTWDFGDLTFATPPRWQALDSATRPLQLGGEPWSLTLSDRPMDTGRGAMLVFSWNEDEYIYSRSLNDRQILGRGQQIFADLTGERIFFRIKDRYNDAQGFDVVVGDVSGGTFHMGCRSPAAQWPRMQDVCDQILASLKVASAPATPEQPADQPTDPQPEEQPQAAQPATPEPSAPSQAAPTAPPADMREAAFKSFTTALEKLEAYEKSKDAADWQAGLEAAQRATELGPDVADYWRMLGYAYSLGGAEIQLASALAEEAYEKSVALDPKNTGARMLLAALLIERKAYSKALDHIEAALGVKAELATSPVVSDMARIYLADELGERGVKFFAGFVARNPKSHAARLGQAVLLGELGRKQEALPLAQRVAADPQAPQTDAEHAKALIKAWQE